MVDTIRGLVRPICTFLVMLALVGILVFLVVRFGSAEMAKDIVAAFLILVAVISGFWFGSRAQTTPQ